MQQNTPSQKRSFWTNPEGFSIVDLLAIMYSCTYLGLVIIYALHGNPIIMNLLQTMSPAIMIILGGYFTGQAVQQYRMYGGSYNTYGNSPYNNGYGMNSVYGQQQYSTLPIASQTTPLNTMQPNATPPTQNNV